MFGLGLLLVCSILLQICMYVYERSEELKCRLSLAHQQKQRSYIVVDVLHGELLSLQVLGTPLAVCNALLCYIKFHSIFYLLSVLEQ